MKQERYQDPCSLCKLECAPVTTKGPRSAKILVVTKAPRVGFDHPLSPQAMGLFSKAMAQHGFKKSDFIFHSAVQCVYDPALHETKDKHTITKSCREWLIRRIQQIKPDIIIPLGNDAATAVMGKKIAITKARGVPVLHPQFETWVMPMLDPEFVAMYPQHKASFNIDCKALRQLIDNDYDIEKIGRDSLGEYEIVDDLQFLIDMDPKYLSFDIEATGLKHVARGAKILTMQFSVEPGKGYMVVWDHPERKFPRARRKKLLHQLRQLLCNPKREIIGQNLKFDAVWVLAKLGIRFRIFHDTLMYYTLLDENSNDKNMDMLVKLYVPAMAGYADAFNNKYDKSRMDLVPLEDLLPYGCGDTDACLRLFQVLRPKVEQDWKLLSHYEHISRPALNAFVPIEAEGMIVSEDNLDDFEGVLRQSVTEQRIAVIERIPKAITRSWQRRTEDPHISFDKRSFLRDVLFEPPYGSPHGCGLTPKVWTKGTEKLPDDKKLASTSTKNHLPFFFEHPEHGDFIMDLSQLLKDERLLGTNVVSFRDKYMYNGRIYPSYSLTTAVTGRTACLRADVPVLTDRGEVRADEVQTGDLVWTHKSRWQPVEKLFLKPAEEMFTVTFSGGESITVTGGHRFLCSDGKWRELEVIRNAIGKQETHEGRGSDIRGSRDVPDHHEHDSAGSRLLQGQLRNRQGNDPGSYTGKQVQDAGGASVCGEQDRRQEPTERKEMGFRVRGWERLPDTISRRGSVSGSEDSLGRIYGPASESATKGSDDSPYRRRSDEQRSRQSSGLYQERASDDPCALPGRYFDYEITEIVSSGVHPVYDFQVAVDSSYLACGVFSHNSRDPNGQNFPKRGRNAKAYRAIFVPPPGWVLLEADLSQAELRIAADMAEEETMLEIYRNGGDIHRATACMVMGITEEQFFQLPKDEQKLARFKAKAVNFGYIYGMGWRKFIVYAKTQYGVDYTPDESERIRNGYFAMYAGLQPWHRAMRNYAKRHKQVRSYSGRIRHLPMIDSPEEWIQSEAERQGINSPVQEFGSSLGLMSMGRIDQEVSREYLKLVGFVHDALYAYVPAKFVEWGAKTLKYYMETNPLERWFDLEMAVPIISDVGFGFDGSTMFEMGALKLGKKYDWEGDIYDSKDWEEADLERLPAQKRPLNNGRIVTPEYMNLELAA